MFKKVILYTVLFSSLLSANAFAAIDDETAYALNTLLFLISGFLVMWMAAGFCMLESGLDIKKCFYNCCQKYWTLLNSWNYVLVSGL